MISRGAHAVNTRMLETGLFLLFIYTYFLLFQWKSLGWLLGACSWRAEELGTKSLTQTPPICLKAFACLLSWLPGLLVLWTLPSPVFYSHRRRREDTSLHFPLPAHFAAFSKAVQCRTSSLPLPFKLMQLHFPTHLSFFGYKVCLAAAARLGRPKAVLQLL